jgi:hypothetical protein
VPSVITATLNSSAAWQLESVPLTVTPVLIVLGGGGLVGEGMMATFEAHDTPVGEITTTHPEQAASGSRQSTVVAIAFMTPSGSIRSTPGMMARQVAPPP